MYEPIHQLRLVGFSLFVKGRPERLKSRQFIKSGSNFLVSWSLLVVHFKFHPRNTAILVNYINCWTRNAFKLLAVVICITNSVCVDYTMSRIRQHSVINLAFTISFDLLSKFLTLCWSVNTDGDHIEGLVRFFEEA